MPKALITGITGQDGAYLAQLLLDKGYDVYGSHRAGTPDLWRLDYLNIKDKVTLVELDLHSDNNVRDVLKQIQADEVYHLAAQSNVGASFREPVATGDANALGSLRLLEALRQLKPEIKFFQASSCEIFGSTTVNPQTETTPFAPVSPYGIAKLYAHLMVKTYRDAYDMFAVSGILYNHESPLRGENFVTRKITRSMVKIAADQQDVLELGNLNAEKDWGYAGDYVVAMWQALQYDKADDYILATGQTHSVKEFVEAAATAVGYTLSWQGEGVDMQALDQNGRVIVKVNPEFFRPTEPSILCGDASKAEHELGWQRSMEFKDLVASMVKAEKAVS